jgi:S-adenosylmethionine hydrolase
VCEGVIAGIAPSTRVIHLTHGIPPRSVDEGAAALAEALPYLPVGVHVAVVDPGVGSHRRPVVIRCGDGRLLVGPDNGLLLPAADRCGGVDGAWEITDPALMLGEVSATFHGRDVFAPVAAHLAAGAEPAAAGEPVEPEELARVELPVARREGDGLLAHVLVTDRFGNAGLNVDHEGLAGTGLTLGGTVDLEVKGERYLGTYAHTFADVKPGELLVYEDAYRTLAVAINRGDAAGTLGLEPDIEVVLRPR